MYIVSRVVPAAVRNLSERSLRGWIACAKAGEMLEYHRGFLAVDKKLLARSADDARVDAVARFAYEAWEAYEEGLVHLVQRKNAENDFSYLVVARWGHGVASAALSSRRVPRAA